MSDVRESTAVGYRLRIEPPGGLSTYPDSVKLMWYQWVVDLGLVAKDRDLARGKDKDGVVGVLDPRTIKYRKSEVGPTTKDAPYGTPSYARSRVRSLLAGRAHLNSAEFFWKFDSVTGRSFARILHYWADEYGHDVFGLSDSGTAWTLAQATRRWQTWLGAGHHGRPAVSPVGRPVIKQRIRRIPVTGRIDLENMDLMGDEALVKRAIDAGQFTGFRRLNARGEQWTPGHGLGPAVRPAVQRAAMGQVVKPRPGPINLRVTQFIASAKVVPIIDRDQIDKLAKGAPRAAVSQVPVGLLRVQADQVGELQDLVNKRIAEWYRDNPAQAPIVTIFEGGKFLIHEGHHRAAGAAMRGDFALPGLIFRRAPGTKQEAELLVMDQDGNLIPFRGQAI